MRTKTIFRNSAWYYLDFGCSFVSSLLLSVLVARKLGPSNLGYFNLVIWLTYAAGQFGSTGISAATRKYTAEYLGRGEIRRARRIVNDTLRAQATVAFVLVTLVAVAVWRLVGPGHRLYTMLAVASLLPFMVMGIYSQALAAAEDFRSNVQVSLLATISNLLLVVWALNAGLGLVGVTGSLLVSRSLDMLFRWIQYLRKFPKAEPGPEPDQEGGRLRERMIRFYWQSSLLMILNMVVWDRSEMLFLKYFCPIVQVAYYSLAFNIAAQFLNFPQIFSEAASATLMVEYGRDPKVTGFLTSTTVRYSCLFAFPLLFGMAATSPAVIQILYGNKYVPAIPVLMLSCALALPRVMMLPVRQQLMTHERQAFLVIWGLITAALNGGVDWALIPHGGALGAALGNGLGQGIASVGIVVYGIRKLDVRLDWGSILKMAASAFLMAAVAYPICQVLRPIPAALVAVPTGAAVYLAMLRWSGALAAEDLRRLATIGDKLPSSVRGFYRMLLEKLIARPEAVVSQSA